MAISSISSALASIQQPLPKAQITTAVITQAGGDNDGDADDHGGPPDADGLRGSSLNIRA